MGPQVKADGRHISFLCIEPVKHISGTPSNPIGGTVSSPEINFNVSFRDIIASSMIRPAPD